MTRTVEQENIIAVAKADLQKMNINKVCIDTLKDNSGTFDERVDRMVNDTIYWEM